MTEPVQLGEIDAPSGILIVLDPGLSRFWRHDGDPRSPNREDPACVDMVLAGPDAEAAAREHSLDPVSRYLFDVSVDEVDPQRERYATSGFDVRAELLPQRVPHTRRAELAVQADGAGTVIYNGLWAVAVSGLPTDRALPVMATPMPDGEFAGRWRSIDVVVDPVGEVVRTETVGSIMVDRGQSMCADLGALGEFRMWESLDGLADFVFWGDDADDLATEVGAQELGDETYGWLDLPVTDAADHAQRTQRLIDDGELQVAVDYQPHDNLKHLNAQIRTNDTRAGTLTLDGARICGFDNRWGDGLFTVLRDLDATGNLVRIRLDVGNDDKQRLLRQVRLLAGDAIVSNLVSGGEHPPRFIERDDEGTWLFFSGAESDDYADNTANYQVVSVRVLEERFPAFRAVFDAPPGSLFRLENGIYVPD